MNIRKISVVDNAKAIIETEKIISSTITGSTDKIPVYDPKIHGEGDIVLLNGNVVILEVDASTQYLFRARIVAHSDATTNELNLNSEDGSPVTFEVETSAGKQTFTTTGNGETFNIALLGGEEAVISSLNPVHSIRFIEDNLKSVDLELSSTIGELSYDWEGTCAYLSRLETFNMADASKVKTMQYSFSGCTGLTSFPALNFEILENLEGTWEDCSGLTSFPQIDISKVTYMDCTWYGCYGLTSFPELDYSSVEEITSPWQGCTGLTSFPDIVMPKALRASALLNGCEALTSGPNISLPIATQTDQLHKECINLVSAGVIETPKSTRVNESFKGCPKLKTIEGFSTASCTESGTFRLFYDTDGIVNPTKEEQNLLLAGGYTYTKK